MTLRTRAWARTGGVALAVIAVDQLTKKLARDAIRPGEEDPIFPALKLVNVRNEGVAFGFDAGGKTLVIALIAFALLGLVLYFARHSAKPLIWLPTGLLIGGALGNIIDRVRYGYVADFLDLHIGEFRPFLIFNVADAAITIGVLLLLARALFVREKKSPPEEM